MQSHTGTCVQVVLAKAAQMGGLMKTWSVTGGAKRAGFFVGVRLLSAAP